MKKIVVRTEILFGTEMGCEERSNPFVTTCEYDDGIDEEALKNVIATHSSNFNYDEVVKSKILYWRDM